VHFHLDFLVALEHSVQLDFAVPVVAAHLLELAVGPGVVAARADALDGDAFKLELLVFAYHFFGGEEFCVLHKNFVVFVIIKDAEDRVYEIVGSRSLQLVVDLLLKQVAGGLDNHLQVVPGGKIISEMLGHFVCVAAVAGTQPLD